MWLTVRSHILVGTLAAITSGLTGVLAAQTEGQVSFEYSTPPSITLNEPVTIQMKIRNGLKDILIVDLGADRKANFIFKIVEPNGSSIQPPQFSPFGLVPIGKFSIGPGQTYSQEILLDEWYKPAQLGAYKVEVSLAKPFQNGNGETVDTKTEGELTFRVGPRDVKVLNDLCGQLVDKVLHGQSQGEKAEAARTLSYIRDPASVPYLGEVLKNGGELGGFAVDGLVRIRNAQAIGILRANRDTHVRGLKEQIDCGLSEIRTGVPCRVED